MLAVTGLPQKFAGAAPAEWIIAFLGGIEMVRTLHHLFAVALILSSLFHLTTVAYKRIVRRSRLHMAPRVKDARDFLQWLRYVLGLGQEHPKFGRYSFDQKIEYLALVWGTAVMIVTGFILLVPIKATSFLPGEVVPAAKAAHGYEAILAVLAVVVWHFYGVHVRQWNRAMLTGTLDEHTMREEHALELERLEAEGPERPEELPSFKLRKRIFLPAAILFFLLCVVGVKLLLTEDTSIQTIPTMDIAPYAPSAANLPGADGGDRAAAEAAQVEPAKCEPVTPPAIPHPVEGRSPCSACHGPGAMKPVPGDHAGRAEATCTMCHATGWQAGAGAAGPAPADAGSSNAGSPVPGAAPAVPHTLEGRSSCSMCHGPAGLKPVPGDHAGRTDDTCTMCHAAPAAPEPPAPPAPPPPPAAAGGPPSIPHALPGRADCGMCHGPGGVKPMPADHAGRGNDSCTDCHRQGDGGR
jgi:cytochrome b subunit of formate dehydrogenase